MQPFRRRWQVSVMNDLSKKEPSDAVNAQVGIFWLVGKRLVLAGTPLAEAEPYGEYKNFPTSHVKHWAKLQRDGRVSPEVEYDEPPRGRVVYNTKTQQFTLMADRCIIGNERLIGRIKNELHLPQNTEVVTDSHYRCAACLGTKPRRKQEQADWDF